MTSCGAHRPCHSRQFSATVSPYVNQFRCCFPQYAVRTCQCHHWFHGFAFLMTEQSRFGDVPFSVPGHAARTWLAQRARTACKSTHTAPLGSLRLGLCRFCPILSCSCDGSLILSNCRLVILGSFSSPSNGVSIQTLWQTTTESQGYLDELASDGNDAQASLDSKLHFPHQVWR